MVRVESIDIFLPILERTPVLFASIAADVPDARSRAAPDAKAWSLMDLLAHLRACAEVWGRDIERMRAEDEPQYTSPSPRSVMRDAQLHSAPFADAVAALAELRRHQLDTFTTFTTDDLHRGATINGRHHTIGSQIRRMALHESEHEAQILAAAAAAGCDLQ